jgi:bacterioferritin-associated ferredoxin
MSSNFIFAESIQKIIRNGEHEIKVSKEAKISPAASDLIKENQIKVIREKNLLPETDKMNAAAADILKKGADTNQELPVIISKKNTDEAQEPVSGASEQDVDKITQMVIERLNELKSCTHVQADEEQSTSADDDLVICRCEEITKKEIKDVIRSGINTLNGIKRVTRSGMGLCQGQTCQSLVTRILAQELGIHPAKLEPTTARAPVRPIRLSVFAGQD